jgi:hypothetical protein
MAEPALTALRITEPVHFVEANLLYTGNDHLRNAVTVADLERVPAVIDKNHLHLTAVISIDRCRRIGKGYEVTQSKPAARSQLGFIPFWKLNGKTRCNELRRTGQDNNRSLKTGGNVHARSVPCSINRQNRLFVKPHNLYFQHLQYFFIITGISMGQPGIRETPRGRIQSQEAIYNANGK